MKIRNYETLYKPIFNFDYTVTNALNCHELDDKKTI